jgi:hypothetical protein
MTENAVDLDDTPNSVVVPYVMPDEVRALLVNAVAVEPICCELIETFGDQTVNFKTRMAAIEKVLNKFVDKLQCKHYFNSVIDVLVWTQTLVPILSQKGIDQNHLNWMNT